MGKKKKGGGAEKTAAKTDKKLANKIKKQLELAGEDDISSIVAEIEREEQKKLRVVEKVISTPPNRRAYFTIVAHPEKDELILFGGEFHNGKETEVYNDLFVYKIAKNEWRIIRSPGGPAPRSGHQAITVASNKGEMWIFGGEFTTKAETQFYHYKDLWCLNLDNFKWERIVANGGPSSRSGHRMVLLKRQIFIFGGYHDNLQDYKYFNDVFIFNLDSRTWTQIQPSGIGPCARSACQMVTTPEGKILIWGGYSKEIVKKDIEQGVVHKDMFLLSLEKGDTSGLKWKWSMIKAGGCRPMVLSGVGVTSSGNRAYIFGGSQDTETEEDLEAVFFNQLHSLDLANYIWSEVTLSGKKNPLKKKRRKEKQEEDEEEEDVEMDGDIEMDGDVQIEDKEAQSQTEQTVVDDGVFTLKVGGSKASNEGSNYASSSVNIKNTSFHPHPRINAGLVIKSSKLYIYGGVFEKNNVNITLSDFHVVDVQKLDEWKTLIPCDISSQEWFESESSSSDSESSSDNEMSIHD